MKKLYILMVAILASFSMVAADYSGYYVKIPGEHNSWNEDGGVQPNEDGIATQTAKIGTKAFKIQVWDGKTNTWYSNNQTLALDTWVACSENTGDMRISGADNDQEFKVEFNCATKEIRVSAIGSGSDDPEDFTIYFDNSVTNWSTVYIKYWGNPGVNTEYGYQMENIGNNIWKFTTTDNIATSNGILFNNGSWGDSNQTANYDNGNHVVNGYVYKPASNNRGNLSGEKYNGVVDNNVYIYYTNPEGWENVYVWAWEGNYSNSSNDWNREPMTKEGDVWKWSVNKNNQPEGLLFSDGNESHKEDKTYKTADLTFVAGKTYTDRRADYGGGVDPGELTMETPKLEDMLGVYYITDFDIVRAGDNTHSMISASVYSPANSSALHSWAKYSDDPDSDNDNVNNNFTLSHKCENQSNAYYRLYMEHETSPFAKSKARVSASHKAYAARVARTTDVAAHDISTGIDEIGIDGVDNDAPVVYYNLQGVRVENPSNGVFIRVQGETVTKELIK